MKGKKKMKEKNYEIKIMKVQENVIAVPSKSKKEAMNEAEELLNSKFRDVDVENCTKHYYLVILDDKHFFRKDIKEVE